MNMNWSSSEFPLLTPPTPPGLDSQVMSPSNAESESDRGWLAGSAFMAEPTQPETADAPKARMVLRALDTDRPEEYEAWRHSVKAEVAGVGPDPARTMAYIAALDQPDLYPAAELTKVIDERSDLKALDLRLYAAILACLKGTMQRAAGARLRAQVPFGAGGLALRKLDAWFNHGAKRRRAAAVRQLIALKPSGHSAAAMETFLSSFRLLLQQAGAGTVGEEVQLDVLQRAVEGHPKMELVWRSWRAAGGDQVEHLLEMLEEATADGMFGARGARPGGAAWAALLSDGVSASQAAGSAPGPMALAAGPGAGSASQAHSQAHTQHQPPADPRRCYGCGQAGHIKRHCRGPRDGGRSQGEHGELLQAVRELVTELRSAKGKSKND